MWLVPLVHYFQKNYEVVPHIFFTNKLREGINKTYYKLNFILTASKMEFLYIFNMGMLSFTQF